MSHGQHQRRYSPHGRGRLLVQGGMPGYSQYHQQLLLQELQKEPPTRSPATLIFDQFCSANTFQEVVHHFQALCDILELKPSHHRNFYQEIKSKLTSWKAQSLWAKLDKRASHKEYQKGTPCSNTRVLIIGGGPVGLRTAIEVVLLGGKAVVLEKRDRFSRNSVLHLWPFLIHDLKALGAKKFHGKFCAGSIDHVSIRSLQCILLKVCLLLGVEIHPGVGFESLQEPPEDQTSEKIGWRANVSPCDHPVSEYEFDVLIGADGKRNTLEGFKRKEFRGKLAIAITANFINRNTNAEARVEEISGVAFIFNQKFFKDLNAKTGIDLENIVYYKDETHYFIMTAKKQSLLHKGVLKKDYADTAQLLGKDNVDQEALMLYAREAADVSTRHMMPKLEYAHNHYGTPDVAMFDFTSLFAAEHASQVKEVHGHKLLLCLAGDSLLEPFWPTGSGCARGFLGALDTAWMIKSWASGKMTPLEVMAERESIYQLLSQTTPENLAKNFSQHTIDPNTRYPNINMQFFKSHQVRHQYSGGDHKYLDEIVQLSEQKSKKYEWIRDSHYLLKWFQRQLEPYKNTVKVLDLTSSWRSGQALCCLIHKYRPELIDVASIDSNDVARNNQMAFDIAEKEFGISPVMSGQDMALCDVPDKLTMVSYLSQFYEYFRKESIRPAKVARTPDSLAVGEKLRSPRPRSPSSRLSILSRISNRIRQRRKEALEARDPVVTSSDEYEREEEKENDDSDVDTHGRSQPSFSYGATRKRLRANNEESNVVLQRFNKLEKEEEEAPPSRVRHKSKPSPGVRGANKVSALAKDLAHKLKGEETPPQVKKQNPKSLIMGQAPSAEVCYFCLKRVYLVERHSAEGVFFHRHCLKCEYCGSTLRIGQYAFQQGDNGDAQFYCIQHLGLVKPVRRPRKRSYDENDQPAPIEAERPPQIKSPERLIDEIVSQRPTKRTPERIEYYTESEMEESEWEQTQHNLSATLLDLDNESESESDSDIDYSDEDLRRSNNNGKWVKPPLSDTRSSDEEIDWSDEELSDGETSWADLAKAYNKRLGRSSSKRKMPVKKREGDDDTETETAIDESDDDWETESETEKESEGEDSEDEPVRPRKVYQISDTVQTTKAAMPMFTQVSPPPPEEREPSEVVKTARASRLSFFSAAPEPVRIDAFSFLGIDKNPKKIVLEVGEEKTEEDMEKEIDEEGIEKEVDEGIDEVDEDVEVDNLVELFIEEEPDKEESSSETESTDEETMTEGSESEEEEEDGEVQIVKHEIPTIQVEEVLLEDSEDSEKEGKISGELVSVEVDEPDNVEKQINEEASESEKEELGLDSVKEVLKDEEGEMDTSSSLIEDLSSSGALETTGDTKESEEVPSISEQQTLDEQESISTEVGVDISESISVNERLSSEEEQPSLPMEFVDTSVCQVNITDQYSKSDLAQVEGMTEPIPETTLPVVHVKEEFVGTSEEKPIKDVTEKTEAMDVEQSAFELPGDIPDIKPVPMASMQDSFNEIVAENAPLASMGEFDSEFMETTTGESALDTEPEDMPTPPVLEDRPPFSFTILQPVSPKHETDALKRIDDLLAKLKHTSPASSPTATLERDAKERIIDVSDLPIAKREECQSESLVLIESAETSVAADLVEVTLSGDENEQERSFVVDETFVTSRDRRKRDRNQSAQSDSSFTISTPSGSIKSSTSSISEMDSAAIPIEQGQRELSLSFDQLVETGVADDSLSLDNLVDVNMTDTSELESPIKPVEIVRQLKEELTCEVTLVGDRTPIPDDKGISDVKETPIDSSTKNGSTFLSAESSITEVTDDSNYFTPDVSGIEPMDTQSEKTKTRPTPLILEVKDKDNSLTIPDKDSPLISPSRLVDAKRRFFFETTQPVRIDPKKVFDEYNDGERTKTPDSDLSSSSVTQSKTISDSISQPLLNGTMEEEKNLRNQQKNAESDVKAAWKSLDSGIPSDTKKSKISGHLDLKRDWQSLDSGVPISSSPTAGVPHTDTVNGEADVFYTPATSLKSKPKGDKTNLTKKSSEAKKRLLPELPTQKSKVDVRKKKLTAEEIKLIREAEREQVRLAARERARMLSDEELGFYENQRPKPGSVLRDKLTAPKIKSKLRSVSDASTRSAPANLKVRTSSEGSGEADGTRPVSSVSTGSESPHILHEKPGAEITSPKSDPSPSLLRRDVYSISSEESKSESCKSDKTKDKKFKVKTPKSWEKKEKTKESKDSGEKKDKRRSFLAMLLPSKSMEKKEKEKENRSKSPKLRHEKEIKELPESEHETRSPRTEDRLKDKKKEKTPTEKKIPKLRAKLRAKSLDKEKEEKRSSAYDDFSPMFEDVFGAEAAPKKKELIQDRLQAVAPAKTPPRSRFPPKATMDEFDTESEFGDDKSIRSFHSQTTMTEEDRARMLRKQEKAAARRQREMELKRLRKAQEIQRQLEEVEQRQRDVETRGIQIERSLRGEGQDASRKESEMMQEWFNVVHEKNLLVRYESELMVHARELELEDRHSRLEGQLRKIMTQPDLFSEEEAKEEEKRILEELLEVVEQRDALVALLEEDRLKEQEEDQNLTEMMMTRGFQLSPVTYMQQMRRNVNQTPPESDVDHSAGR